MAKKRKTDPFDPEEFLATVNGGRSVADYKKGDTIFTQGEDADAVFYLRNGKVKVATTSSQGKEAIVALLDGGSFFGEGCLIGQPRRLSSAKGLTDCTVLRIAKPAMVRALQEPKFAKVFTTHLLIRNTRIEEDLVDQLFNSSEKRLARILLLLANIGRDGQPDHVVAKVSQETLAEMVGTTRPRINQFMNKFRKLGFIEYNGDLAVHSSLLSVVLRD